MAEPAFSDRRFKKFRLALSDSLSPRSVFPRATSLPAICSNTNNAKYGLFCSGGQGPAAKKILRKLAEGFQQSGKSYGSSDALDLLTESGLLRIGNARRGQKNSLECRKRLQKPPTNRKMLYAPDSQEKIRVSSCEKIFVRACEFHSV